MLTALDLPAILELEGARRAPLRGADRHGRRGPRAPRHGQRRARARPRASCSASGPDASFYLWTNFESLPALKPGMKGAAVRWLQARLTELGYLKAGDASGEYDELTANAVKAFQRASSLEASGAARPRDADRAVPGARLHDAAPLPRETSREHDPRRAAQAAARAQRRESAARSARLGHRRDSGAAAGARSQPPRGLALAWIVLLLAALAARRRLALSQRQAGENPRPRRAAAPSPPPSSPRSAARRPDRGGARASSSARRRNEAEWIAPTAAAPMRRRRSPRRRSRRRRRRPLRTPTRPRRARPSRGGAARGRCRQRAAPSRGEGAADAARRSGRPPPPTGGPRPPRRSDRAPPATDCSRRRPRAGGRAAPSAPRRNRVAKPKPPKAKPAPQRRARAAAAPDARSDAAATTRSRRPRFPPVRVESIRWHPLAERRVGESALRAAERRRRARGRHRRRACSSTASTRGRGAARRLDQPRDPPGALSVAPGAELELAIEALAAGGDGVAHSRGLTVFVRAPRPATACARASPRSAALRARRDRRAARARPVAPRGAVPLLRALRRLLVAAPRRGGAARARASRSRARRSSASRGRAATCRRSKSSLRRARSATALARGSRGRGGRVGFRARGSHEIVDVERCAVLDADDASRARARCARRARGRGRGRDPRRRPDVELAGRAARDRRRARSSRRTARSGSAGSRPCSTLCGRGALAVELYCGVGFYTARLVRALRARGRARGARPRRGERRAQRARRRSSPSPRSSGRRAKLARLRARARAAQPAAHGVSQKCVGRAARVRSEAHRLCLVRPATLARDLARIGARFRIAAARLARRAAHRHITSRSSLRSNAIDIAPPQKIESARRWRLSERGIVELARREGCGRAGRRDAALLDRFPRVGEKIRASVANGSCDFGCRARRRFSPVRGRDLPRSVSDTCADRRRSPALELVAPHCTQTIAHAQAGASDARASASPGRGAARSAA